MGSRQLFQIGVQLIRDRYHRNSHWAENQLNQSIALAEAQPLTDSKMKEIMKYDFGIDWDRQTIVPH